MRVSGVRGWGWRAPCQASPACRPERRRRLSIPFARRGQSPLAARRARGDDELASFARSHGMAPGDRGRPIGRCPWPARRHYRTRPPGCPRVAKARHEGVVRHVVATPDRSSSSGVDVVVASGSFVHAKRACVRALASWGACMQGPTGCGACAVLRSRTAGPDGPAGRRSSPPVVVAMRRRPVRLAGFAAAACCQQVSDPTTFTLPSYSAAIVDRSQRPTEVCKAGRCRTARTSIINSATEKGSSMPPSMLLVSWSPGHPIRSDPFVAFGPQAT